MYYRLLKVVLAQLFNFRLFVPVVLESLPSPCVSIYITKTHFRIQRSFTVGIHGSCCGTPAQSSEQLVKSFEFEIRHVFFTHRPAINRLGPAQNFFFLPAIL